MSCNCSSGTGACNCTSLTTPVVGFSPENYTPTQSNVTGHLQGIDTALGVIDNTLNSINFTSPNSTITIGSPNTLQATYDVAQYAVVTLTPTDPLVWTSFAPKPIKYKRNANKQITIDFGVYLTGSVPTVDTWNTIATIAVANDRPINILYLPCIGINKDTFVPVQNTTWVIRITTAGLIQIYIDDNIAQLIGYCLTVTYNAAG